MGRRVVSTTYACMSCQAFAFHPGSGLLVWGEEIKSTYCVVDSSHWILILMPAYMFAHGYIVYLVCVWLARNGYTRLDTRHETRDTRYKL
ncbi:hypothetical protein F5Y00DRAFT_223499 [Daldinia vernicosa]|uniref:uncharacterized protein n=1 Tax=Daldinia vernicosa TaxID=114800 RepID=UPI002007208F|nr:uncharacterized protein F5Y00DRAFT_223499 [Daldinia vernicosa]KAI0853749.1 hypothetical protein F5Y00DRAFT_223499 [Daldinia vernicosa]